MDEVADSLNALPPGPDMTKEAPRLIHQKISLAIPACEKVHERLVGQVLGSSLVGVESRGFGQAAVLEYSIGLEPDRAAGAYKPAADITKSVPVGGCWHSRFDKHRIFFHQSLPGARLGTQHHHHRYASGGVVGNIISKANFHTTLRSLAMRSTSSL